MIRNKLILGLGLLFTLWGSAQDNLDNEGAPLHVREVPRYNLSVGFGVSQPLGEFKDVAGAGLNIGVSYDYYFNKNLALSTGFNHAYNEFRANDRETNENADVREVANYQKASFSLGPLLTLRDNRFQFDAYGRLGYSFLNTDPKQAIIPVAQPLIGQFPEFNFYQPEESKDGSMYMELGLRFNYYFRKQVQLFFNPALASTFGEPVAFTRGSESYGVNMTNLHFNIGVKIALGKEYSNGEKRVDEQ
ncbi:hypothetical protein BST97_05915 [Nonlabens spongiae]|uniref:Outer membrane protein beta-barrel domain-containing protein n=1 Tax=Nonlabens spongiae TaxID=331648 RepID=A0A1W6MIY3_9FLAO|nr:outer membrane beta-barrel protein [Nonlabens spongiae]ARN77561.1 hypothetical protein BST97_05915 [Nonlabens spongiae]